MGARGMLVKGKTFIENELDAKKYLLVEQDMVATMRTCFGQLYLPFRPFAFFGEVASYTVGIRMLV